MPEPKCSVCRTQHGPLEPCRGELKVSEPERHGWRVLVNAGARTEVYGVLIAPADGVWRARILTYPRMLWSIPGERGTLKLVGATPGEAEANGAEFIRAYCERRGYAILGEAAVVESSSVADDGSTMSQKIQARRRFLKNLPILFGRDKPEAEGLTTDLSHGGLFVMTERPLPPGSPVKLRIGLDGFSLPLTGHVAWSRTRPQEGRPVGMGVQLTQAPPMYRRYVERLREREATSTQAEAEAEDDEAGG